MLVRQLIVKLILLRNIYTYAIIKSYVKVTIKIGKITIKANGLQ